MVGQEEKDVLLQTKVCSDSIKMTKNEAQTWLYTL